MYDTLTNICFVAVSSISFMFINIKEKINCVLAALVDKISVLFLTFAL